VSNVSAGAGTRCRAVAGDHQRRIVFAGSDYLGVRGRIVVSFLLLPGALVA
jgi:hypothetical protein